MKQTRAPVTANALVLTPSPGRKLSVAEKRFNKLLAELQSLRTRITTRTAELEASLQLYAAELAPAASDADLARQTLILELGKL